MNTVLWPGGSQGYDVLPVGDHEAIGHVWLKGGKVTIEPKPDTILAGIAPGPYSSREEAMQAIATHTKGACEMGGFVERK